jgi:2-polyprenyl-3-methyl-5-hydroxy-6-metoxy-1,4-benzoquinol methylase
MPYTDKVWERFGLDDPYHAVLTKDKFLKDHFDQAAREAFFRSGQDYAAMVLNLAERHLCAGTHFNRVLDFGCGVGRLSLAFALHADEVIGADISSGMLAEAKRNADEFGACNTQWVLSDDNLTRVTGDFDFVHTFITLQHLSPERGYRMVHRLVGRLRQGGIGILHLTFANASRTPMARRLLTTLYEKVTFIYTLRNLLKRLPSNTPQMHMSRYDLSRIMRLLQEAGCHDLHLRLTEASHYGYPVYGAIILFRKEPLDVTNHS